MFEVGFSEILLIFGIALLVLGPERLPKLAADVGRWAGRARAMARQLRSQLEQEVHFDPLAETGAARASAATSTPTIQPPAALGAPAPATTSTESDTATRAHFAAHGEPAPHADVSETTTHVAAAPDASHTAQTTPSDEPKPG